MEIKTYAPVIIPTLNRFDHFRRLIESLARCTHANKTEVVIGLDYPPSEKYVEGYEKIKTYLPTITGFKKITVFTTVQNLGQGKNMKRCFDYVFQHYDRCICSEDDNEVSPCFLDYMNKALGIFKDDPKVVSVSGYNHREFYNQGKYKAYYTKDSCAWGVGFWQTKETTILNLLNDNNYFKSVVHSYFKSKKIVDIYPALYSMLDTMIKRNVSWGDVKRTTINILEGYYQIQPAISLVRNNGFDGSGEHCGIDENWGMQEISKELIFDFSEDIGPFDTDTNKKALYCQCLSKENRESDLYRIRQILYENTLPFYTEYKLFRHYVHITRIAICKKLGVIK